MSQAILEEIYNHIKKVHGKDKAIPAPELSENLLKFTYVYKYENGKPKKCIVIWMWEENDLIMYRTAPLYYLNGLTDEQLKNLVHIILEKSGLSSRDISFISDDENNVCLELAIEPHNFEPVVHSKALKKLFDTLSTLPSNLVDFIKKFAPKSD